MVSGVRSILCGRCAGRRGDVATGQVNANARSKVARGWNVTQYGAGVECEGENVLFLFSLGCVSFKGPSMNPGSVPPS